MLLRLKKRAEYLGVAKGDRKFVTRTMVMQYLPHPAGGETLCLRAGFTVTRKQGGAVVRNRIRRRLKEALRLTFAQHPVTGWDIVIIGRRAGLDHPFSVLLEDMRYALGKLAKIQAADGSHDR